MITKFRWFQTFLTYIQCLPNAIWSLFIEALLVPSFRFEWGRYKNWSPFVIPSEKEIFTKRTLKRKRRHLSFQEINTVNIPQKHDHRGCQRLKFNVSGRHYETQLRTLSRYPNTLLGDPSRLKPFYNLQTETYYFDRHRDSFEMILYYYQSGGRVVRPLNVEIDTFLAEMIFFDLGSEAIVDLREQEGLLIEDDDLDLPSNLFQRKIWLLFEHPESSAQSTIVAITSIFAIVISISSFCLETLLIFDYSTTKFVPTFSPYLNITDNHPPDSADVVGLEVDDVFVLVETVCVAWFSLELIVRLVSCPNKTAFCMNIMNMIDFIAIVPYFVQLFSTLDSNIKGKTVTTSVNQVTYLAILRVIKLVRVFRIFKLSRHSKGLQILGLTLQASLRELGLLIFFLVIGVILFSSAVYFAELELEEKSLYPSIPHAFYWGVVTMTTVGYGDVVPKTIFGKIIGSLCAVAGVLTIALPVPVIVSNFNFFYHRASDTQSAVGSIVNSNFVRMCPFLPTEGVHPDLESRTHKSKAASSMNTINETITNVNVAP